MKNLLPIGIITALILWYLAKQKRGPELEFFEPSEFGPYWPLMSEKLLIKLDEFRRRVGYRVSVSPAVGSIGRPVINLGEETNEEVSDNATQHNYLKWGEVRAIDIMPRPPNGATPAERRRWFEIAKAVGFTGIGIYPHWRPRAGLHVDVRVDHEEGRPATWAGVRGPDGKQTYTSIEKAFV